MIYRYLVGLLLLAVGGCTSLVKCEEVMVQNIPVSYCLGKVSGDGQEGVFRDASIDGKPVLSSFGSGSSLWGQALQGAAGDAALAGGMVGAARSLRPNREYNSVGSANTQNQEQEAVNAPTTQVTAGATGGSATSASTSGSMSKSGATATSNSAATSQSSSNSAVNRGKTKPTPTKNGGEHGPKDRDGGHSKGHDKGDE